MKQLIPLALAGVLCWPAASPAEQVIAVVDEAPEGLARKNRLAVSFGGAAGWGSFSRFHDGVDSYIAAVEALNPDLRLSGVPKSEVFGAWQLGLRYYSPVRFFAQLDLAFLHNGASADLTFGGGLTGSLSNVNLVVELALVVGYYRIVAERGYIYAGVGPTVVFLARSYWHYDHARVTDFAAPHGGGFHAVLGAEWMLSESIAVGIELRYRFIGTGELENIGPAPPPVPPLAEIAISGVAPTLFLRWFVWDFTPS